MNFTDAFMDRLTLASYIGWSSHVKNMTGERPEQFESVAEMPVEVRMLHAEISNRVLREVLEAFGEAASARNR